LKRPSFQFYPGDWTSTSNLRRCSHAEKGIWIDVMCLLHDQEEYGVVRWPLKEIAQAVNCSVAALKGLVVKGILKGGDAGHSVEAFIYVPRSGRKDGDPVTLVPLQNGPIWYSSRMVKDEYVRTIRGESSRFGATDGDAPKQPSKGAPKPPLGGGSSSSSSSSPSGKTNSVPDGTDAGASGNSPTEKSTGQLTKDELWAAGKSLLMQAGMPKAQCGSYVGKLVKDYGDQIVIDAVRTAVVERPADAASFLKATCQTLAGHRARPNRQEQLEAKNRQIAERLAREGS